MKKRFISILIMLLVLVPPLIAGGIYFPLLVGFVAVLAFTEVVKLYKYPLVIKFLMFIGYISIVLSSFNYHEMIFGLSYNNLNTFIILLLLPSVFFHLSKKYTINDALSSGFLLLIIALGFHYLILLRNASIIKILFAILIPTVTDLFAYLAGVMFGKNKISKLSPNKSWEGSLAGALFAVIIAGAFYYFLISKEMVFIVLFKILLISISAQLGDFFFSGIKREYKIKDFSNLIPGHGGVLDRIDSTIFTVITYFILFS